MKIVKILFLAIIGTLFLYSCDDDQSIAIQENESIDESMIEQELSRDEPDLQSLHNKGFKITVNPMLRFSDAETVGISYLVRKNNKIFAAIKTKDLDAGTATTFWWVMFNKPENCDSDCGEIDLTNPAVGADIIYADGKIVKKYGSTLFFASRTEGDLNGSIMTDLLGSPAVGLEDAMDTEVHFVLRTHGPVVPGMEEAMTTTFNGGCQGFPPELGEPGPNNCEDIQFAVHKPF